MCVEVHGGKYLESELEIQDAFKNSRAVSVNNRVVAIKYRTVHWIDPVMERLGMVGNIHTYLNLWYIRAEVGSTKHHWS